MYGECIDCSRQSQRNNPHFQKNMKSIYFSFKYSIILTTPYTTGLLRNSMQKSMEMSFFVMPFFGEEMHMRNMGMSFFGMPFFGEEMHMRNMGMSFLSHALYQEASACPVNRGTHATRI